MFEFDFISALIVLLITLRFFNYEVPYKKSKSHRKVMEYQVNQLEVKSNNFNANMASKTYSPLYSLKSKMFIILNLMLFISATLFLFNEGLSQVGTPMIRKLLILFVSLMGVLEVYWHYKAITYLNSMIYFNNEGIWIKSSTEESYYPWQHLSSVSSYSLSICRLYFHSNKQAIYMFKGEKEVSHLFKFIKE